MTLTTHTIDVAEVRRRHPIADVVAAAGVELHRSGRSLMGCCPFHEDSTASLSVGGVPDRFHCFGCGASGDVIDFVRRRDGLGFRDAVAHLDATASARPVAPAPALPPTREPAHPITPERGLQVNALAWEHFSAAVPHAFAVSYLRTRRGIDTRPLEHAVGSPVVGHAGTSWTGLIDHLQARGVTGDELVAMDLAQPTHGGGLRDTFRSRLVVPVRSPASGITGFIGRNTDGDPRAPKYRNPTLTAVFDKSTALYAPTPCSPGSTAIVVEGPIDALAVAAAAAQAGRLPEFWACATSGVTVSSIQARRVTDSGARHVVIALDGDRAGVEGTRRWIDVVCRGLHRPALVTHLFPGSDPADWLARHGPSGLDAFDPHAAHGQAPRPVLPGPELVPLVVADSRDPVGEAARVVARLATGLPRDEAIALAAEVEAELTDRGWDATSGFAGLLPPVLGSSGGPRQPCHAHAPRTLSPPPVRSLAPPVATYQRELS